MTPERRPVGAASMLIYTVCRSHLLESGIVYKCLPSQHDDLGISCAMLAWAARHPHLPYWTNTALASRRPRRPPKKIGWTAWT